jgi:Arc/MetJ-type ribon-helix-helix transcriptional regulator
MPSKKGGGGRKKIRVIAEIFEQDFEKLEEIKNRGGYSTRTEVIRAAIREMYDEMSF